ncbi:L,D-transpeptidase family protein [Streptomyces shenzhenensis]|uniref:L,D-transpeptidase family protein n=1 Tax=Streptomyces shenzhenensis TaxID=943815 RepID=UPI0015F09047|nr:L,D-transpeptidase family protein [Streptomyces shenzhenensis]
MQIKSVRRATVTAAVLGAVLAALSACEASQSGGAKNGLRGPHAGAGPPSAVRAGPVGDPGRVPGVGELLQAEIPADSGQVVAVYGEDKDSADATVVLYTRDARDARDARGTRDGGGWRPAGSWPAHNGRSGWTRDHHAGDGRSPVGVFTVTDAGGVLPDPGTRLSYAQGRDLYAPPRYWSPAYQHDFDYVIAVDYNRLRGRPPHDTTRPWGDGRGGSIWLHLDHGRGTSACIGLPKDAMEYLLRTLDPARDPVVVMGDRPALLS